MSAWTLCVEDRAGNRQTHPLAGPRFRIGKHPDNNLVLQYASISRFHCELLPEKDVVTLVDLGSRNGTYLDGERLTGSRKLPEGSQIQLGEYVLTLQGSALASPASAARPARPSPAIQRAEARPVEVRLEYNIPHELLKLIHQDLLENLDLKRVDMSGMSREDLFAKTRTVVEQIVQRRRDSIPAGFSTENLIREIVHQAVGLGPIEDLLADDSVTEIMVNSYNRIYVERKGKIQPTGAQFLDNQQVIEVIRRIIAPLGRRIDETSPMVDARLFDGSRVNAIIPPLAISGPTITIRKFSRDPLGVSDLISFGAMTDNMARFLEMCVVHRKNICISGGTGSGKTTLLNVLSAFIPSTERIVTIEDAAELRLPQDHVVSMESKPPNLEGHGAITIRKLVINSLRMRPDRIIVGECRGGEALDMLQAMNTGHDGSLTTLHANTCRDAISRLETMVLMAGMDLPAKAILDQIASAVDIIVQTSRISDGSRKVTHITAVAGREGDVITLQDIFRFVQEGYDREGKVKGHFESTNSIPAFMHELKERGLDVDMGIFS